MLEDVRTAAVTVATALLEASPTAPRGPSSWPPSSQGAVDHWAFVRAGLPGVRLGSVPYAGYRSAGDVPAVVDPAQLDRPSSTGPRGSFWRGRADGAVG